MYAGIIFSRQRTICTNNVQFDLSLHSLLDIYRPTPGHIELSVMCPTADMCLTADTGVTSLILARSYTFMEIDHEIISTAILLPSADSRRVVVSYRQSMCTKYWITT